MQRCFTYRLEHGAPPFHQNKPKARIPSGMAGVVGVSSAVTDDSRGSAGRGGLGRAGAGAACVWGMGGTIMNDLSPQPSALHR
jgi:hypothetical protein